MKITILTVGKIKEKFYRDAVSEFAKRLSRYCKLEIIEVPDEKTPDRCSRKEAELIRQKEGGRLLCHIRSDGYVIVLAIDGRQVDSIGFAHHMEQLGVRGTSHIYFVIGGSLGLSEDILARADEHLSFSMMTFPHQLMRVILLEQVYRSCRIMNNEPYHK